MLLISREIWIHRSCERSLGFWGNLIVSKLVVLSSCKLLSLLVLS